MEEFFKAKNIRFKNEMLDDVSIPMNPIPAYIRLHTYGQLLTVLQSSALIAAALDNEDLTSDEEGGADRGSADEDEESIDEDFQAESESDPAEEYDSAHESSGSESESDAEMDDASDVVDEEEEEIEEERPKKKTKVGK